MKRARKPPAGKTRSYDKTEAEAAIAHYCSYQERTLGEVRKKLRSMKIEDSVSDEIIRKMSDEGFISEQRYADAYVRGKLNQNKWGRLKVTYLLNKKGINRELIDLTFTQFGEEKYRELARKMIRKKYNEIKEENPFAKKQKTARFMISKGFESQLVWEIINEVTF